MDKFQQTVVSNFKRFNSISNRNGMIVVAIQGRGIDKFEFVSPEAMQADELGKFFISKMNRDQKAKVENGR